MSGMQRVVEHRRSPLIAPDKQRTDRLELLDRVRGTALFGVLFVNLLVFVADAASGTPKTRLDRVIVQVRESLFDGKFYPIFALVFGYSLAVQMRGAGLVSERRTIVKRRLGVLAVLGLIHALTLYRFDILFAYGILGALSFRVRRATTRSLLIASAALIAFGSWIVAISDIDATRFGFHRIGYQVATQTYRFGTFTDLVRLHAHNHLFNLATEATRQWPHVLAMMLIGIVAERFDLANRLLDDRSLVRRLLLVGSIGLALNVAIDVHSIGDGRPWLAWVAAAAVPLQSVGYIALIACLPRSAPVDAAGRMSLTVYLAQSAVCTTVLYGFGFGLGRWFSPTGQLLFAIVFYALQCALCARWLRTHGRGPVEWLVHEIAARGLRPPTTEEVAAPG